MKQIIFAPIEQLEERYSAQWFRWFIESFGRMQIKPIVVGDCNLRQIKTGQFLDVYDTCLYKASQMSQILHHVANGFDGTIFFMDGWFPGIEHLAYMRNNAGAKIKLVCILHAGTWDDQDFLSQNGCRAWARHCERGWLEIYDRIIVATEYHANLIRSGCSPRFVDDKIVVAPFPVYRSEELAFNADREDLVVFPHRLAPEKRPEDFLLLERSYREYFGEKQTAHVRFVRTKDVCKDKTDYYKLMSRAKVAFSAATQETFGIAMLEAVAMGCTPIAPDRLSYVETLDQWRRYGDVGDAVHILSEALIHWKPGEQRKLRYRDNADALVQAALA